MASRAGHSSRGASARPASIERRGHRRRRPTSTGPAGAAPRWRDRVGPPAPCDDRAPPDVGSAIRSASGSRRLGSELGRWPARRRRSRTCSLAAASRAAPTPESMPASSGGCERLRSACSTRSQRRSCTALGDATLDGFRCLARCSRRGDRGSCGRRGTRCRERRRVGASIQRCEPQPLAWRQSSAAAVVALEGEAHQLVDELGVGEAAGLPQLRVHRDRGEAGDGVDLVDQHAAPVGLVEEVDAGHAVAPQRREGGDGESLQLGDDLGRGGRRG